MELPLPTDELCAITNDLLRRNRYREDVYIRPLIFKSAEIIGVKLHDVPESFAICTAPMGNYVGTGGIRCMVSSWRRIDDTMAPARAKCTGLYVNSALAKSEALQGGFDEAILLTMDGHVSEGSAENIFIVRQGNLYTPPPSDNILEGITRQALMHLAREELGLDVVERSIDRSELYSADEVFMCGTGAQVAPGHRDRPAPHRRRRAGADDHAHPGHLQRHRVAARNDKYAEWLSPVYPEARPAGRRQVTARAPARRSSARTWRCGSLAELVERDRGGEELAPAGHVPQTATQGTPARGGARRPPRRAPCRPRSGRRGGPRR